MLSSKKISLSIINLPFLTVHGSCILSCLSYSTFEPFMATINKDTKLVPTATNSCSVRRAQKGAVKKDLIVMTIKPKTRPLSLH